jgi:hypothetical protein
LIFLISAELDVLVALLSIVGAAAAEIDSLIITSISSMNDNHDDITVQYQSLSMTSTSITSSTSTSLVIAMGGGGNDNMNFYDSQTSVVFGDHAIVSIAISNHDINYINNQIEAYNVLANSYNDIILVTVHEMIASQLIGFGNPPNALVFAALGDDTVTCNGLVTALICGDGCYGMCCFPSSLSQLFPFHVGVLALCGMLE